MILRSGHVQAAGAALLTRRRIAWDACLDMPIGLTMRQEPGTGTAAITGIAFGEPGLRSPGASAPGVREGWLVVLGITNPGLVAVHSRDFTAPLAFAFPGREIHATQIRPGPAASTAKRAPRMPSVKVSAGAGSAGDHAARMELSGDFQLRPGGGYSVMLVLTGTPADSSRPIQQGGSLTGGKIVAARPGTSSR